MGNVFMRIGVVSDTHNNLLNCARIVELFNESGVERVVHTGDITQAKTVEVFADLRPPLYGVFGNNDLERASLEGAIKKHGFEFVDPPFCLYWEGRSICIVHDPLDFSLVDQSGFDLLLHGHTHRYTHVLNGRQLMFNPGECAGLMPGLNAIGLVDLATLEAKVVRF
jgi:hypothetical protein